MAILKSPRKPPKNETLQICAREEVRSKLAKYAEFTDSSESYVVSDANEATGTTEQDTTQLLTVSEVARRLSVTCNWVYTHADKLGVYRLGKYLRFFWPRVLERLQR